MSFKILLPVTTPASLVEQKLSDLAGLEKQTIVVNNWTDPETEKFVKEFARRGAETYGCTYNLGLGASWNLGMRRMMEDQDDFVIILSASAVFDKPVQWFVEAILRQEENEKMCRYICSSSASLHCFAHTKLGVEMGGYFDENFWPIYYEDTDYSHRSKFNGVGHRVAKAGERSTINTQSSSLVKCLGQEDVVHSYGASVACNTDPDLLSLHQHNCHRWSTYYVAKWGGNHGSEQYCTPFNDPIKGVNEWSVCEPFYHPKFPGNWNPPPALRY